MPNHLENKVILITGSTGYLGSALVRRLSKVPCRIILLVRKSHAGINEQAENAEVTSISGDICVRETWEEMLGGIDYIFHFAAQTSIYTAGEDPLADFHINTLPILHLLETCRLRHLSPKILFAGTVTQSGLARQLPVDEASIDHPITIYDIHKLMAEKYLRYYAREIDTQTVTLRLANVYGPGPLGGRVDRGILNGMIYKALQGEVLTIYGDGAFLRDYVFIDDVVNAFFLVSSRMPLVNGNYYIIGSGQGVRIVDAVRMVADRVEWKTGRRPAIAHVPPPDVLSAIETRNFVANTTGFRTVTGWEPRISLKEGIDLTINHLIVERT